ncbi:PREDICTED: methylosome protein 50-like [Priapulus caudatus]|uniref:Methylosome protein 50-like n=1 Tax=Priapulus caudatus TaxID=37621 RepID=A0ABM1E3V1_PRICU|nr:PREDICTED: methylosome protein 50-like [Priapulus caudatus]
MANVPAQMDPHLQGLSYSNEGYLFLCASDLIGRYWSGTLCLFRDGCAAPDITQCLTGCQTEGGLNDVRWITNHKAAVASDSGGLEVWEVNEARDEMRQISYNYAHDDAANSLDLTCDSHAKAVTAGSDGRVFLWDLETNTHIQGYRGHTDIIWNAACHSVESNSFVSCSKDGSVLTWDLRQATPASVLKVLSPKPSCVAWQPGGINICVGTETGGLLLLDGRQGAVLMQSQPHSRFIHQLAFCPNDSTLVASVSNDCSVIVTKISTTIQAIYANKEHMDFVRGLCWQPDSTNMLTTCGWDTKVLAHTLPSHDESSTPIVMELGSKSPILKDQFSNCHESREQLTDTKGKTIID